MGLRGREREGIRREREREMARSREGELQGDE